jgi:hypothetical protein
MLIKTSMLLRHPNGRCHGEGQTDLPIAHGTGIRIGWCGATNPTFFAKGSTLVASPTAIFEGSGKRCPF